MTTGFLVKSCIILCMQVLIIVSWKGVEQHSIQLCFTTLLGSEDKVAYH